MINWGVIGFGRMGKTFTNCFKNTDQLFQLRGIASNSNSKNKNEFYKNYDDLINSSEIDALYISTLNNTHKDLATRCIKQNKKVLCEKPLGLNLNEVKEIYDLLSDKKDYFFEAIAYRSHPQTLKLKELLEDRNFGKVKKVEANFGFKVKKIKKDSRLFNKSLGGGSILDLGCYPVSFFSLLTDDFNNLEVIKSDRILCETNVDVHGEIELRLNNQVTAIGRVSLSQNLDNICRVYCENAIITVSSPWLPSEKTFLEIETKGRYFKEFIITKKNVYEHQLENVSLAFKRKNSKNSLLVNIEESLEISRILDEWLK
tara:strand:- start:581 stop:1525 length:945 start_codon:yes stop_codon:yes gene_type:complete